MVVMVRVSLGTDIWRYGILDSEDACELNDLPSLELTCIPACQKETRMLTSVKSACFIK
jgi:hypothetical protein